MASKIIKIFLVLQKNIGMITYPFHKDGRFFLMAGPCVVEDENSPLRIAETLTEITSRLGIPFIFKASYRKANRSRLDSFTGIGDEKALNVLGKIRQQLGIPVVTDIHSVEEAAMAAEVAEAVGGKANERQSPKGAKLTMVLLSLMLAISCPARNTILLGSTVSFAGLVPMVHFIIAPEQT